MNDSKKKFKVFIPILFALVLVLGMFFGFRLRDTYKVYNTHDSKDLTLNQILNLVNLKYVDSVQLESLQDHAINGILDHLDPHSVYISPKKLVNVKEDMQGHYQGIGIGYFIIKDTINVSRIIKGGSAEKAGIEIGDKIIREGDSSLAGIGITADKIKKRLRGPNRSEVNLKILRNKNTLNISLKRGMIPLKSIEDAYFIKPGIAYLRINRFSSKTYSEFMDAVVALKQQDSIKKFILDLRDNPGGFVESAVNVADEFLSDDKMVVYTEGKNYPKQEFKCSKIGELEEVPLAVLVNGRSASASEILAGAIQDWDRGYLIGRQTFGKGLVQEQYRLTNGAALRLTVARYYLPSGRLIQRPYKNQRIAYQHDLLRRYEHGELLHKDSIHFKDTTAYYTLKDHRKVHAGDGVLPDIFVPIDTMGLSSELIKLYEKHILFQFAVQFYYKNKASFAALENPEELLNADIFKNQLFEKIKTFSAHSNIALNRMDDHTLHLVEIQIKAFIARILWRENGYYFLINQRDESIHKALQTLEEKPDLKTLQEEI